MASILAKTRLFNQHVKLGAKMVPFAGYEMPLQYQGIVAEHHAVRNAAGLFDVSHMGEFRITGPQAAAWIQWHTCNNVLGLQPGRAHYTCLMNPSGGVIDDLIVFCLEKDDFLLVVNAANREKDWNALQEKQWDAKMEDLSDTMGLLALQGPKAENILAKLNGGKKIELKPFRFEKHQFEGIGELIVSATGYTGAGGYELYFDDQKSLAFWNLLMEAGKEFNLQPAGLGCRDTLRLEMGYCLYGQDLTDETSPLEADLSWLVRMKQEFIGKEILANQKETGIPRKLTGLKLSEKAIPRAGYTVIDLSTEEKIGNITSGGISPTLGQPIAMAYLPPTLSIGDKVGIQIRKKVLTAEICSTPFI